MKALKKYFQKQCRIIKQNLRTTEFSWLSIHVITGISVCTYFFLEWIFLITKPSFFGSDPFRTKVNALLFATSIVVLATSIVIFGLYLMGITFQKKFQRIFKSIALIIPVLILSSLVLLLIDNFTYVVFDFGIVSTHSWRFLYTLLFIFLISYFYVYLIPKANRLTVAIANHPSHNRWIPIIVLLTLFVCFASARISADEPPKLESLSAVSERTLPNIVIITADGVDAQHMSAYGYTRETTPNIDKLINGSLVAENAFTNSANTAGSLISIYTGKYPTDTRVLFAPDILKNQNTTEHLLSLLKSSNYSSTQFSYPYYADAYDLNVRSGFDYANGRPINSSGLMNFLSTHFDSDQSYFIYQISSRLLDRLSHIFYIKNMVNLSLLADGNAQDFEDQYKFDTALQIINQSKNPTFIHIHYLGTHGPEFYPKTRMFSANKDVNNQQEYDPDFYDDSILDFDNSVGQFIEELKKTGQYENTILIIGSDHGEKHTTNKRIPLIIHFPNDEFSGKIYINVQNIDIAPTILDYLKVKKPLWMAGDSLLSSKLDNRPIFSFRIGWYNQEGDYIFASNNKPPFYQFGYINVNYCNKYYGLTFDGMKWESGSIEGYTGQCDTITDDQAYQLMVDHLAKYGFDVSSLKGFSFVNQKN